MGMSKRIIRAALLAAAAAVLAAACPAVERRYLLMWACAGPGPGFPVWGQRACD
jgi:hypothetical protein